MVIVVVGVMDGFQARLTGSLIENTSAVVVEPHYDVDPEALCKELKARIPGVLEASPIVFTQSLVTPEGGDAGEGYFCHVVGIDPALEDLVSNLGIKLRRGSDPRTKNSPSGLLESASFEQPFRCPEEDRARNAAIRKAKQGVVIGKNLLEDLRLQVDDQVQLFTLKKSEPKSNGNKPTREKRGDFQSEEELFRITGVFRSGDYEVDKNLVLMDRRDALSFFKAGMRQEAREVRLLLDDVKRCDEVKAAIRSESTALATASLKKDAKERPPFPALTVRTWKDDQALILAAVDSEKGLLIVIASFSFIVVAFLIGSTQSMLVVEKTREIGVLRSLGASVAGTSGVFVANGLFIGTVGAAAGCALGLSITSHIQAIAMFLRRSAHIDVFPQKVYRFDEVPIHVSWEFLAVVCGGAVLFALLGSILPAMRASMLDPVESLHHE
jgi:ABC-type lipoprotein release transport system permease subunit